ncbi:exopolygalacturonase [Fusarium sp. NRRL 52700]|nr:exopolygalacturonase [Fusarium sp. NRRL 52700]
MLFNNLLSAVAVSALVTSVVGTSSRNSALPKRPHVEAAPYGTGKSFPVSPVRSRKDLCYVNAGKGKNIDDAPSILKAFKKCNKGGTIVLDQKYSIASPLDLTWLSHVDVIITGEVNFKSDPYYWADHSFKYDYQNMSSFWKIGGKDINIYGDLTKGASLLDGHGQAYWEEMAVNKTLLRPILLTIEDAHGLTMSNLRMRNPPNWFNIIVNSTDVLISDLDLEAKSLNGVKIANSDGWDTYRSDRIVIQDSVINNTDDCVSFKPNSTNVVVQNLVCNGSHGISVGSLGQYKGETDIVENLYIYNISMSNASDGARIKVWPGVETAFQDLLNGGGGLGRVRNVTYDTFYHENNDNAITITQCYGQKNQTLCNEFPANLTIKDVTMKNFWGTVSTKYDPRAGSLVCSAPDRCSNIVAEDIRVQVPSKKPPVYDLRIEYGCAYYVVFVILPLAQPYKDDDAGRVKQGLEGCLPHSYINAYVQEVSPYRGAPFPKKWRRNHPRSKNGCLTCRTKRKKCDEAKPICTACDRSQQDCLWPKTEENQQPDMQLSENTTQASSSNPPQNISLTAYGVPNVQSALRAAATSSPRAAPAYGNLAYLSDNSRRLYQHYVNTTAEMLTRGPSLDGNPFVQYLLPLASHDALVLNCVLAIGGAHVVINDTSPSNEGARGLEIAARGHYANVLSGIQKLLYYRTGQTVHTPEADTAPPSPSRVLLILLLLCVFDHVQGSSRSSIYHHLRASQEYITLITNDSNAPDELRNLRGFILELYAYHTMKLAITPRSLTSDEFVEVDPSVRSLDVLSGYKSRGYLIGFGKKLFELVPKVAKLVEARRKEEEQNRDRPTALTKEYNHMLQRLHSINEGDDDSNGLRPYKERAGATMIYQNALIVYLQSAFYRNMLANPELMFEIEQRIDQMMPNFYTLFVSESPFRRMLLWPGVIMGSCARSEKHIMGFRAGFKARATGTPGAVKTGARIIELLWNDPDPRAFGPRGLSYIMTKHGISCSLC